MGGPLVLSLAAAGRVAPLLHCNHPSHPPSRCAASRMWLCQNATPRSLARKRAGLIRNVNTTVTRAVNQLCTVNQRPQSPGADLHTLRGPSTSLIKRFVSFVLARVILVDPIAPSRPPISVAATWTSGCHPGEPCFVQPFEGCTALLTGHFAHWEGVDAAIPGATIGRRQHHGHVPFPPVMSLRDPARGGWDVDFGFGRPT